MSGSTSFSLLERLRVAGESEDWRQLVSLYGPLIRNWAVRKAAASDLDDVVQDVLTVVARKLPLFQHNQRPGAFRAWLKSITVNCLRDLWKRNRLRPQATGADDFQQMLLQLEDPASGLSRQWDREHDLHVLRYLHDRLRGGFSKATWRAYEMVVREQRTAEEAAAELDITVNAVYIAKSRVLTRLRQEAQGLLET